MSQHGINADDHITRIQILSFFPDPTIDVWFSSEQIALQSSLNSVRKHSDCVGVYWMRQIENPSKIVVISKWKKDANEETAISYIPRLLPHLKCPPQNIHVRQPLFVFTRYTTTNFITVYFPTSKCCESFQKTILGRVADFSATVSSSYSNPENLVHVGAAWVEETQKANGRDSKGLIVCLTWNGKKAERHFERDNIHWRDLMDDIRSMGAIWEQECHGEVVKIARKINHETDGLEEFRVGDVQNAEPSTWTTQILSGLKEVKRDRLDPAPVPICNFLTLEAPVTMSEDEQDISDQTAVTEFKFPVLMMERALFDTTPFEDETPDSSPILTPSSSCASLDSLYNGIGLLSKQCSDSSNSDEELIFRMDNEIESYREFPQIPAEVTGNVPEHRLEEVPGQIGHTLEGDLSIKQEKSGRYGVARWDPEVELERAKYRFSKHGKRVPALRLQGYQTSYNLQKSEPSPPIEEEFVQEVIANEQPKPVNWKTLFKSLLVKKSVVQPVKLDEKYLPHEKIFEDLVQEANGRCYRMPGTFQDTVVEKS